MTLPAWDLDSPADAEPSSAGSWPASVLLLAVALASLGLGGLTGSAVAPAAAPRSPTTATLNIRDLYVDLARTGPGPSTAPSPSPSPSPSAPATSGSGARAAEVVIAFRLRVDNPGSGAVQVTSLVLEGVSRTTSVLPLDLRVAGRETSTIDVTARADCSADREPATVRAWLRISGAGDSDPELVRIAPSRALSRVGGLCSEVNAELPNGWRAPLQASTTRLDGLDLELTIENLPTTRLAGLLVDDRLLPTVFVGEELVTTTARPQAGGVTQLRLQGPPPCIQFSGSAPIPSTVRLLAEGEGGIQQRLVVVGPALTRWLRLDCTG
jgi:hypothetical protein